MVSSIAKVAFAILPLLNSALARDGNPPAGQINGCHTRDCEHCNVEASNDSGFPNCIIYDSATSFGGKQYHAASGSGYDVWWNSGPVHDTCKVIVRSPAAVDMPGCGKFVRDWDREGCYYTPINQDTFMLQLCCGRGDCGAAEPALSPGHARSMALQGRTATWSYAMSNSTSEKGQKDIDENISLAWKKRTPSSGTQLPRALEAAQVDNEGTLNKRAVCRRFDVDEQFTKTGRQVRVSDTQDCNLPSDGSCKIEHGSSITVGRTANIGFTANLLDILMASTGVEFAESRTRSLSVNYMQPSGTRGYVSFTPYEVCVKGHTRDCYIGGSAGSYEGEYIDACTPQLNSDSEPVGEYSFVYA